MNQCRTSANPSSDDTSAGLAEIQALLTRLSKGDTSLRADVDSETGIIRDIKELINQLAEHIQETSDYAHEMAIGLCEHYDTLSRIAGGDFSARATMDSENEVVGKMGELINREADVLTGAISRAQCAEEEKQSQLQLLQTLIDTIPSPVYYKDSNGCYLGCNKAFENSVGLSRDKLIGKTALEIWPMEQGVLFQLRDKELFESPGEQIYEETVRNSDGTQRETVFNKATFHNEDGSLRGLVGIMLDITERKRAEEEAKNAYQQLQDIIEFLPDATFVVDKDKQVIAWNRAIEIMTGLKKDEVIGKGDYIYSIPFYGEKRPILIDLIDEDLDVISCNYTAIKIEGRTLFAETFVPTFQNGGSRCFWGTATPLFDKQGNQVGGIESIRDITEYRQAEHENIRLESQLHHARMMESFMIKLGHDLRTPLTPLTILLPLIGKRVDDQELKKLVDICCKSTFAMKKLADKTQLLGNISSSVNAGKLECINLFMLVERALGDNADNLIQKDVVCRNDVDQTIAVPVIQDQLTLLFDNLISNAIKYSPENGVIRINAEQQNSMVTVAVHDDGIGLAPEHLERIFDEFYKADESRHDIEASGLGLSICKRIVRNHHGRIWAESPGIGRGTTIKFTLNEQCIDHLSVKEPK